MGLRIERFRIFYVIEGNQVNVVAVGHKEHNELSIRGNKVEVMTTIELNKESPSVDELLAIARREAVVLVSADGARFVLEGEDDFDREVALLGNSGKFMEFLAERSRENGVISIEQFAKGLGPGNP
jgi:hypothetical protein